LPKHVPVFWGPSKKVKEIQNGECIQTI
jgi:hypothetical protein